MRNLNKCNSMASIRFKFRTSTVSGKQGTLFIQVIHRRVARHVSTQYKLYPGEWASAGQSVTVPKDTRPDRSRDLHAVQEALQQEAAACSSSSLRSTIAARSIRRRMSSGIF